MKLTNKHDISLPMAVMLAYDEYDNGSKGDPFTISVTSLIKPVKQTILGARVPNGVGQSDVSDLIASSLGTAVHNHLEKAWKSDKLPSILSYLGYPKKLVEKVIVNPEGELPKGAKPIYTEYRTKAKIGKYTISGEFDFCISGQVRDLKNTSVWKYMNSDGEDYILQMSMYRWLNQDKIIKDTGVIDFILSDWSAANLRMQSNYPPVKVISKEYPLMPIMDTQAYIERKLGLLDKYWDSPEEDLPVCTDKDLWVGKSQWKYYKNPKNTSRSTKNFDNPTEAYRRLAQEGSMGIVVEVKGTVKACKYCPALPICQQAQAYLNQGILKL